MSHYLSRRPLRMLGVAAFISAVVIALFFSGQRPARAAFFLNASASCSGNNFEVTISGGDQPFNITGTGPGMPLSGLGTGIYVFSGPSSWTNVTVTEVGGD